MGRRPQANPMLALFAVFFLLAGIGAFAYISLTGGISPKQETKDTAKVEIIYYDADELPDEVNTTDPQTDEDAHGQTTTTSDNEGQTETDQTEEKDEEEDDPTPDPIDDTFKGTLTIKVEYVGASGGLLSILPLEFVKSLGGEPLEKLRITYAWDFDYGKDIDPESVSLHVSAVVKRVNYQGMIETWRTGTFTGGKVFDQYVYNVRGSNTENIDIEDPDLGFHNAKYLGDPYVMLWTTEKDFVVDWEAIVSTYGGTPHKIFGTVGVKTSLMWDATVTDPDGGYTPPDYSDPYFYDPSTSFPYGGYQDTPLISIVPIG